MENRTAIITYGYKESSSILGSFCKSENELKENIQKALEDVKFFSKGKTSFAHVLINGLEKGILDGSDLMILATITLADIANYSVSSSEKNEKDTEDKNPLPEKCLNCSSFSKCFTKVGEIYKETECTYLPNEDTANDINNEDIDDDDDDSDDEDNDDDDYENYTYDDNNYGYGCDDEEENDDD